ncbi:nuclear transport factor 2 family protein [Cognatishimia sp. F0-27]|uniref:nuclear transport factor 2 family protein n=1 Tax=Cognatishimia sp. F0-27 TaxID=2816855 RepID=UPI001D0C825B|nr:nuclear transport factor 2 family protein [Cognatishimia sp. F0-27]MCC1492300.1 nuclear transport factor 2 family protein [Cognatishimia sp. F0-27]
MTTADAPLSSLYDAATAYCDAVWAADAAVFETLCHERFAMTMIENGSLTFWDKAAYLERVRGRVGQSGPAVCEILSVDAAGGEIGRVHLTVAVPPVRYEDHLGFVRVDGTWQLLTKVFRTCERLDDGEQA